LRRDYDGSVGRTERKRSAMGEYAYVYILANGFKKLYIGVTAEIEIRIRQHKQKKDLNCHTAKYNINQLVYFERFTHHLRCDCPGEAIQRLAPYPQTGADYFD
jgi:predicted GIY-YIG superfamily endonuclease